MFVALVLVTPEIVDAIALLPWYVLLGKDWNLTPFNNGLRQTDREPRGLQHRSRDTDRAGPLVRHRRDAGRGSG